MTDSANPTQSPPKGAAATSDEPPVQPISENEPIPTGQTPADVKQMADLYHVPLSDETINAVAHGADDAKMAAFENYLKVAAEGLYPTFASQIRSGIPTAYLLDPYRQVAKSMLGEAFEPDFIGNPRDVQALEGATDPKTGHPTPMSLDQWRKTIASDPRFAYDKTPHAVSAAQYTMQQLHQAMTEGPSMTPSAVPGGSSDV